MSQILDEVLAANAKYAENFGAKGNLPLPPMDARLDPAKYAGLAEGDAHVIRNAGGRASDDAIRSLVMSYKLLGTRELFVVHHTDCGMLLFTNDDMRNLLASSLKTATLDQSGWRDDLAANGGGCDRISLRTALMNRKITPNGSGIRGASDNISSTRADNHSTLREGR